MILVDTNVISEPLRQEPEPRVIEWIDTHPFETAGVSVINPWE